MYPDYRRGWKYTLLLCMLSWHSVNSLNSRVKKRLLCKTSETFSRRIFRPRVRLIHFPSLSLRCFRMFLWWWYNGVGREHSPDSIHGVHLQQLLSYRGSSTCHVFGCRFSTISRISAVLPGRWSVLLFRLSGPTISWWESSLINMHTNGWPSCRPVNY
jgi:hypothetical protein